MQHTYQDIPGWFDFEEVYRNAVENAQDGSIFVEIGSFKGKSTSYLATEILLSSKQIDFYAVDTWIGSKEHRNPKSNSYEQEIVDDPGFLFKEFTKNIENVKSVVKPIQTLSTTASKLFKDESVDFVFIDASHDFESVCEDIRHWLPKVKTGGTIAGHDYDPKHEEVCQAVEQEIKNFTVVKNSWVSKK